MTRILGIDPGSIITGYGIIDIDGNHAVHVCNGTLHVKGADLGAKLGDIFTRVNALIREYTPDESAVEQGFMHRNADSALKLGQARGAAITACSANNLRVFEYTANPVKQETGGKGHAAKQQGQHMVKVLLCLNTLPAADAADALAVALCHGHYREGLLRMQGVQRMRDGRRQ